MPEKKLTPRQFQKNQQAAQKRWRQQHAKNITLQFNTGTDSDVLDKLSKVHNKTDYIRKLIRADIDKNGIE